MYPPSQHAKRRKKRVLQGHKTVAVVRGKLGYGFTISGQNPCMLSCIVPGSPAELAGLKPGDLLYFVNGQNVSRVCHDDVVRMVGLSTGTLELQVAENSNSSDSSDDDYPPRSKSRYPNRVRSRHGQREKGLKYEAPRSSRYSERKDAYDMQHYPDVEAESELSSSFTSQEEQLWSENADIGWRGLKQDRMNRRVGSADHLERQNNGFAYSAIHCAPVPTSKKVASAVVKKVPHLTGSAIDSHHSTIQQPGAEAELKLTASISNNKLDHKTNPRQQSSGLVVLDEEVNEEEILPKVADSVKAVVGYIGSIETPSSHTRPHQRLQALRSAVRRLRVEQRVHTLVLMEVSSVGVVLTNAMGKQLALYSSDRIAFSGICPDDKRFFGLVTLSIPDDDCSSYMSRGESTKLPHSSCHIFMIEPELSPHSAHDHQAETFQIKCTTNSQTRRCEEFPMSATSLILCIANLYRDAPPKKFDTEIVQSQALADPVQQAERSNSNSSSNGNNSNSDSGLGFGKEEAPLEQNEQVCVIDLPNNNHLNNSDMSVAMDTSGMSFQQHLSPDIDVTGTPRPPHSTQRPLSAFDLRRGMNNSTSSEECWQIQKTTNKLTPRAMPDPAYPPVSRCRSTDNLDMANSNAESLRQSMQRLLQARQQQLHEQNCQLGSDGESHAGDPVLSLSVAEDGQAVLESGLGRSRVKTPKDVFAVPVNPPPNSSHYSNTREGRSAFQVPRPVSAPLGKKRTVQSKPETVDMETMGKLSPRAFPHASPSTSVFRSPSAPPAPFFPHRDSDEDDDDDEDDGDESEDDPYIRQILDQFSRDRKAVMDEDSRRFSEGFALSKKREKEKHEVGSVQKWTKAGSFRLGHHAMYKQSFSQSHESLAVGDDPNGNSHKLIAANSVNSIACQTADYGQEHKAGRVASWAVNFDKLLKDTVGIEIFKEFLRKEFSEENIIFWKACEQYRQLADEQQRKTQAKDIYARYLSTKASDPVNVDSAARSYTEKFLDHPTTIMFDVAQQQIFQLMRQDSYARFLKSDVYKNKLMEEMEGKPLELDEGQKQQQNEKVDKKKGKGKENDDKRRRSILPWRQNKKSSMKSTSDSKKGKEDKDKEVALSHSASFVSSGGTTTITTTSGSSSSSNNANAVNLKKAPGPGIDLSTMRKEVFQPKELRDAPEAHFKFCRIVMPDGSTTVVCAKPGQTSRAVLSKLCEKRSISIASVDVFLLGSDRPLDLTEDISTLGSKEIVIERRVLFRLDLPNNKSIGVKAKPNRSIRDVFKPILQKYGYRMDGVAVHLVGSIEFLDLDTHVSEIDNQRAVVSDINLTELAKQGVQSMSPRPSKMPPAGKSKGSHSGSGSGSLEEITNKIFEDLMRGKSQLAHGFDELGVLELDKAKAHKNEEVRFSGLFGLLRRESLAAKDNRKNGKVKSKVTFALPRTESKKKGNSKEGEHLFEMLSDAQNLRLEEQRGVQISTGDMPSFLCHNEGEKTAQRVGVEEVHLDDGTPCLSSTANMFDDVEAISGAGFLEKGGVKKNLFNFSASQDYNVSAPRDKRPRVSEKLSSEKWKSHGDQNLSGNGAIPSADKADAHYRVAPVIVDSQSELRKFSVHKSLDEVLFAEKDAGRTKLDVNLSSHFTGSHAFRPVHLSSDVNKKAPFASPEKCSPESKKLRSGSLGKTRNVMSPPLPNKMSMNTRSSSTSSNMSSGHAANDSPTPISTSPSFPTSVSSTGHNVNRLSDNMLLHKLQQARRSKEEKLLDDISRANQGLDTHTNVPHRQGAQPDWSNRPSQFSYDPKTSNPPPYRSPIDDQQDLAQRALLSPRFNQSPQQIHKPSRPTQLLDHDSMAQRALLSPRFDQNSHMKNAPPPYQSRNMPFTSLPSTFSAAHMLSPRYSPTAPALAASQFHRYGAKPPSPNGVPLSKHRISPVQYDYEMARHEKHNVSPSGMRVTSKSYSDGSNGGEETVTFV